MASMSLTFPVDANFKDGSPAQFVLADEGMWKGQIDSTARSMAASRSDFGDYFGGGQATSKPEGSYFIGD